MYAAAYQKSSACELFDAEYQCYRETEELVIGGVLHLNFATVRMLGKERSELINSRVSFFYLKIRVKSVALMKIVQHYCNI